MPKSARKTALCKALSMKLADNEIIVLDKIPVANPKTKEMVNILGNLGLADQSVLLVLSGADNNILLSARNIPAVRVVQVTDLNAYQVAAFNKLVFTEDAIKKVASEEARA
jgi:large subunit ribosomal protein L4